jgi:hypothetical protein
MAGSQERAILRLAQKAGAREQRQRSFADVLRKTTQSPNLSRRELQAGHFDVFHLDSREGFVRDWRVHAVSSVRTNTMVTVEADGGVSDL